MFEENGVINKVKSFFRGKLNNWLEAKPPLYLRSSNDIVSDYGVVNCESSFFEEVDWLIKKLDELLAASFRGEFLYNFTPTPVFTFSPEPDIPLSTHTTHHNGMATKVRPSDAISNSSLVDEILEAEGIQIGFDVDNFPNSTFLDDIEVPSGDFGSGFSSAERSSNMRHYSEERNTPSGWAIYDFLKNAERDSTCVPREGLGVTVPFVPLPVDQFRMN